MTTQYSHRITIAVPENLTDDANHLAAIIGESPADINTFSICQYRDDGGGLYSVSSFVAKPSVLGAAVALPETPVFALNVDRTKAQAALDTLNQPGGIIMIVDVDPIMALEQMGLSAIETDAIL